MQTPIPDTTCQTCFRSLTPEGSKLKSQWKTYCRCSQPYNAKSQFSLDVCANCKKRVPISDGSGSTARKSAAGVCSCANPNAMSVPTYIKQNETDPVTVEPTSTGAPPDCFPVERFAPIGILGDSPRALVFLCRDRQRGNKVAVKCFKKIAPSLRSTFESEVRKNKELSHTSIAKIVDAGFHKDKSPYLVTEYKDGFNVEQCLAINGAPSHDVVAKILIGICESLIYAQKQGVMHRDLRPGNVIFLDDMNSEPSVSVVDYALPKIKMSEQLTEPWEALYMSADEARNMEYNEKSEVYAVGAIGYTLMTGRAPFEEGTTQEIKNSHALKLPPRISSVNFDSSRPKDLEEVIEKCLEKDPRQRFDTIAALMERLQVFPQREQRKVNSVLAARKQKKILKLVASLVALAGVCGLAFAVFGHH